MTKKIIRLFIVTSLLLFLTLIGFKANATSSYVAIEGAQIRLAQDEYQGLRFVMSFDTNAPYTPLKYGVVVYPDVYDGDLNIDTEGAKYNYTTELSTINEIENAYAFTIYGYKRDQYIKNVTVRAFVQYEEGGVTKYDYSSTALTKSIYEVANLYYQDNQESDYVNSIVLASNSYETLKAELLADYNTYASTSLTFDNFNANSTTFLSFIQDEYYGEKWYFFFDEIVKARVNFEDEIEAYATANYAGYSANSNKTYYTPYLRQIIDGEAEPTTGRIHWPKEISALFTQTCENYYNAHTLDYSDSTIYNYVIKNIETRCGTNKEMEVVLKDNEVIDSLLSNSKKLIIVSSTYFNGISNLYYKERDIKVCKTLEEAFDGITDNTNVYVLRGTKDNSNITISNEGIGIYGPNKDALVGDVRKLEATLTGTITIANTAKEVDINGLKFGQSSKIVLNAPANASTYISKLNFESNNCDIKLNNNSFVKLSPLANAYTYDLRFENNIFTEASGSSAGNNNAVIYLDNTCNTYFINNVFNNISSDAIHFNDTTKGMSGLINKFIGNEFNNVSATAIYVNWLSSYPNGNITGVLDITNNTFNNVGTGIYLGKYNNSDVYKHLYICDNDFSGTFGTGIYIARCVTKSQYQIYGNTFNSVPTKYYVNVEQVAGTSSAINALVLFNNYNSGGSPIVPSNAKFVNCNVEADLEFVEISDEVMINESIKFITNSYNTGITWTSSDKTIAIVSDEGVVTGLAEGIVTITALHASGDQVSNEVTVVDNKLIQLLKSYSIDNVWNGNIDYVGTQATTTKNINGAASYYYFDTISINDTTYYDADYVKTSTSYGVKFVTVHDTAGNGYSNGAASNGAWCMSPSNDSSSWHYTVGNDGIYQHYSESYATWHAGDGSRQASMQDTGVKCNDGGLVPPTIAFDANGCYAINGISTTLKPYTDTAGTTKTTTIYKTSQINDTGIYWTVGVNGNYYLNKTYYNTTYKKVCNFGGNRNSIGIETACNSSSDIYLTWQMTAKLVAQILVRHDLTPKEVMQHHSFSGKNCPACMRGADMWDEFKKMVEVEYQVLKYYSDYTITFTSDNTTYLDNHGRVVANPSEDTEVTYTITVSKGGQESSVKLSTIIPAK